MQVEDQDFAKTVKSANKIDNEEEFVSQWPEYSTDWLEQLYSIVRMPPKQLLTITGRPARRTAMHWGISQSAIESWSAGKYKMPVPVRLALAHEAGLLEW